MSSAANNSAAYGISSKGENPWSKCEQSRKAAIPSSLVRQCLQLHHPDQKFSGEAVDLSSELLRMFVVEARRRAAIEAECEAETEIDRPPDENDGRKGRSSRGGGEDGSDSSVISVGGDDGVGGGGARKKSVEIRADHVARIAAELLLDLS